VSASSDNWIADVLANNALNDGVEEIVRLIEGLVVELVDVTELVRLLFKYIASFEPPNA
jgi:hypothetical protein